MTDTIESKEKIDYVLNCVDIKKLLSEIENVGGEKEKEEFIKNYSRIKEEIKIIDEFFTSNPNSNQDSNSDTISNTISNTTNELEFKTINELFEILEQYDDKIFNNEPLSATELKLVSDVCKILEKKINADTISIIEN